MTNNTQRLHQLRLDRERAQTTSTRTDARALNAIAHLLRDPDWGVGMFQDIAELVTTTGRDIANYPDDLPTWDRH